MKKSFFLIQTPKILFKKNNTFYFKRLFTLLLIFGVYIFTYSQNKGGGKGTKDIIIRACTQYIGNGLYRVNFGYDNPSRKNVAINENDSYVISNNGKNKTKGLNSFKSGSVEKAFTREFNANESVEWTIINPSGKVHTVIANVNSSHCPDIETGFIFPVFGQGDGKRNDKYGSEGFALAKGTAGDTPSEIIYQLDESKEKVLIEIVPKDGKMQQTIDLLQNIYFIPISDYLIDPSQIISKNLTTIDVFFPISQLDNLNLEETLLNFIRVLYPSIPNIGIVTTQGDSVQRSNLVRNSFRILRNGQIVPVDGTGIKTGVMSDSYDTQPFTGLSKATIDVQNGDLPGIGNPNLYEIPVEVFKEYPFGIASDEGRAMMHIIHDVAPGSQLGFYSAILSPRDFELGVNLFMAEDYDIVVDDITFITEPFFGNGRISQAIKAFTSLPGKTYFSSAGNFSNNGYQSIFNSSSILPSTNFLPASSLAKAHVFDITDGIEDVFQKIHVVPGIYMIVLQWDQGVATQDNSVGAISDLDIYIVDDFGNLIVGNNRTNELGDPTEIIVFQSTGTGEANIMITSANGTPVTDLPIRYIAFRSNGLEFLEYSGAPTTSGHAMTSEANIIAAFDIRNAEDPDVQLFSSHGGNISNGFYSEIDFSAPNGVFTNVSSIGQYVNSDDTFTSFFGTSASAPHAAAGMALLMSVQPSWFPDGLPGDAPSITNPLADQAIQLFKQNATSTGNQDIGGAGFIDLEKVFKSIATQTPKLLKLILEDGKTPGIDSLSVTIIGEYFLSKDETTVIFDGKELDIVEITETEIVVEVSPFTSNPCLIVSSDSSTPGGTDGGDSNCLQLLEKGKLAINIIADDIASEFGQSVNFSFHVEGLPENVSYESTGLPEVKYSTPAVFPYPDVNNYILTPYLDIELTEDQINSFQINFINGFFSVVNKDLLIKPEDAVHTYGEPIEIVLNYEYDPTGIADNNEFLSMIKITHQNDYYQDKNSFILFNDFRALINDIDILELLEGSSWISTERTIVNEFRALINNIGVIDLDPSHFTDYYDAKNTSTTNDFRALINDFRALINTSDLFNGTIYFNNDFRALINDFRALINDSSSSFTVIHEEDAPSEVDPERIISNFYASDLITGIHVDEESHYILPGTFLNQLESNFQVSYASGRLTILPATLNVTIEPNDLVIYQGDILEITASIEGFVYDDTLETVFPDGIPFYLVDDQGNEFNEGDVGVFDIKIREPQNYLLVISNNPRVYINPYHDNIKKVRTYLDCVKYNPSDPEGLIYTAVFSYENDNFDSVFVFDVLDNNLSGPARFEGQLPNVFFPGSGSFEIRFDGNQLVWSLTTYGSTHKSSVSSSSTSESGKCDGKIAPDYEIYPNPVTSASSYQLTIQSNVVEASEVRILDLYGSTLFSTNFDGSIDTIVVDLSSYESGMYFIRIINSSDAYMYSILKE